MVFLLLGAVREELSSMHVPKSIQFAVQPPRAIDRNARCYEEADSSWNRLYDEGEKGEKGENFQNVKVTLTAKRKINQVSRKLRDWRAMTV